jgi:hypothetical protein
MLISIRRGCALRRAPCVYAVICGNFKGVAVKSCLYVCSRRPCAGQEFAHSIATHENPAEYSVRLIMLLGQAVVPSVKMNIKNLDTCKHGITAIWPSFRQDWNGNRSKHSPRRLHIHAKGTQKAFGHYVLIRKAIMEGGRDVLKVVLGQRYASHTGRTTERTGTKVTCLPREAFFDLACQRTLSWERS